MVRLRVHTSSRLRPRRCVRCVSHHCASATATVRAGVEVTTLAGSTGTGGATDGFFSDASFTYVSGMTFSEWGRLMVSDLENQLVRAVTIGGQGTGAVYTYTTPNYRNPSEPSLPFMPWGLVNVHRDATLWSGRRLEEGANSVHYLVCDPDGAKLWGITSSRRVEVGAEWADPPDWVYPQNIVGHPVDKDVFYVLDEHSIRRLTFTDEFGAGSVTTVAGIQGQAGLDDGVGPEARFNYPYGITISPDGETLFVADGSTNHCIRRVDLATSTVTTFAGSAVQGQSGSENGIGTEARFYHPGGIAMSPDGTMLAVADSFNHVIRNIVVATAEVGVFAGTVGVSGAADGPQSDSPTFERPWSIAWSPIVVTEGYASQYVNGGQVLVSGNDNTIRKISLTKCTRPSSTPAGYWHLRQIDAPETFVAPQHFVELGFYVGVECDTGYEGTAVAHACTSPGAYSLSGCTEIVCTTPSDTTGFSITEHELSILNAGFDVTAECDTGFEGTAVVTACTSSRSYGLSGCTEIVCTTPSDTTGFSITEHELSILQGFDVTAQCDTGFEGTAVVTVCNSPGPYNVSGCTATVPTKASAASANAIPSRAAKLFAWAMVVSLAWRV